jgi:hypothetical protein
LSGDLLAARRAAMEARLRGAGGRSPRPAPEAPRTVPVTLTDRAKAVQDRLSKAHRQQMLDKAPGRDGQVADSPIEPTETTAPAASGPTSSSGPEVSR